MLFRADPNPHSMKGPHDWVAEQSVLTNALGNKQWFQW